MNVETLKLTIDIDKKLRPRHAEKIRGYLSSTFIIKFLTLKDTEDSQSPPASLTQTALQNEPLLLANQFRLD